jgi:hypothetical protein
MIFSLGMVFSARPCSTLRRYIWDDSREERHLYLLLPEQMRFLLPATIVQLLHNHLSLPITMDNIAITDLNSKQTLAHQTSKDYVKIR